MSTLRFTMRLASGEYAVATTVDGDGDALDGYVTDVRHVITDAAGAVLTAEQLTEREFFAVARLAGTETGDWTLAAECVEEALSNGWLAAEREAQDRAAWRGMTGGAR